MVKRGLRGFGSGGATSGASGEGAWGGGLMAWYFRADERSIFLAMTRFLLLLAFTLSSAAIAQDNKTGGPFVPTPQGVVDAMLEMAEVGPRDYVIDLGSGDGRIVLTAAKRFNARGVGIEIDKDLVDGSNAEARKLGIADRVAFRKQDVLEAKIDEATVLTLYLLPGMMNMLQPKLARELKPGTRIVSHDFPLQDWKADRERVIDVPEKYGSAGNWKSTLYYWIVPAKVDGQWELRAPAVGEGALTLALQQQFQFVDGVAVNGTKRTPISGGRLEGARLTFTLPTENGPAEFHGTVDAQHMRGDVTVRGRTSSWTAMRGAPATAAAQ